MYKIDVTKISKKIQNLKDALFKVEDKSNKSVKPKYHQSYWKNTYTDFRQPILNTLAEIKGEGFISKAQFESIIGEVSKKHGPTRAYKHYGEWHFNQIDGDKAKERAFLTFLKQLKKELRDSSNQRNFELFGSIGLGVGFAGGLLAFAGVLAAEEAFFILGMVFGSLTMVAATGLFIAAFYELYQAEQYRKNNRALYRELNKNGGIFETYKTIEDLTVEETPDNEPADEVPDTKKVATSSDDKLNITTDVVEVDASETDDQENAVAGDVDVSTEPHTLEDLDAILKQFESLSNDLDMMDKNKTKASSSSVNAPKLRSII